MALAANGDLYVMVDTYTSAYITTTLTSGKTLSLNDNPMILLDVFSGGRWSYVQTPPPNPVRPVASLSWIALPLAPMLFHGFYQGVLTSIVSLVAYIKGITLLGAPRGAAFSALVPVLVAVLGIPLIGEWPTPARLRRLRQSHAIRQNDLRAQIPNAAAAHFGARRKTFSNSSPVSIMQIGNERDASLPCRTDERDAAHARFTPRLANGWRRT